jgi:hypothetical protein
VQMSLINVAAVGDVVTIRRLVEGADVNLQGDRGARPLHAAARACGCSASAGGGGGWG